MKVLRKVALATFLAVITAGKLQELTAELLTLMSFFVQFFTLTSF